MPSFGEGLNFSDAWLDLPPQFMGSSTSLGPQENSGDFSFHNDHQNDLSRMLSAGSGMMPPPPPPSHPHTHSQSFSHPHQHSDDVLNAAATLLQNGNRATPPRSNSSPGNNNNNNHNANAANRPVAYPVGHLRHQPMEEFREENRKSSQGTEVDHTFTRWMWGSKEKTPVSKPALADFQWGSDASFSDVQGYVPEPRKESVESMHQTQMKCLECLEVNQSAANTRPGSPANGQATSSNGDGSAYMKREEDPNAPPRKRRKSKNVRGAAADEDDEDDDDATSSKSGRKRKTKSERSASGSEPPSDTTGGSRRRKSGVNGAKPPRENLSEEQKRENHIRSEQKRRTLIKEGFDDLGELVPGLKGGGFSKSTTLTMAAEWLDELLRGNKALAMQVSALEQR